MEQKEVLEKLDTPKGLVIIRFAKESDLHQVIGINRRNLPENYPPYFFKMLLSEYPKAFLVAQLGDKLVGYVMCRIEISPSTFPPYRIARIGHIVSLAVEKDYRRMGIGEALMVNVMKCMREYYNVDEYILEVRVSNMPARKLYEKLGFRTVRILPAYYHDGEDGLLMARPA